jgi:hypothetical protein
MRIVLVNSTSWAEPFSQTDSLVGCVKFANPGARGQPESKLLKRFFNLVRGRYVSCVMDS